MVADFIPEHPCSILQLLIDHGLLILPRGVLKAITFYRVVCHHLQPHSLEPGGSKWWLFKSVSLSSSFPDPSNLEYRNKTITRFFGGNSHYGCYFLTVAIFSFGILRDSLYVFWLRPVRIDRVFNSFLLNICDRYHRALMEQPRKEMLPEPFATLVPAVLFVVGQTFVITSTWALGITGTFLGDYFGIFMDRRVEGSVNCVLRSIQSS